MSDITTAVEEWWHDLRCVSYYLILGKFGGSWDLYRNLFVSSRSAAEPQGLGHQNP